MKDNRRLVVRLMPVGLWIAAGFCLLMGLYVFARRLGWPAGIILMLVGLALLSLSSRIVTVTADKDLGTLVVQTRSLFGVSSRELLFNEVRWIEVESSRAQRSRTYRVVIVLHSGERLPLTHYYSSGYGEKERKATQLCSFLDLPPVTTELADSLAEAEQMRGDARARLEAWRQEACERWHAPEYHLADGFLLLFQIPVHQPLFSSSGLGGMLSSFLFQRFVRLYGFDAQDLPGLENARPWSISDQRLAEHFAAFTSSPAAGRLLQDPWLGAMLVEWACNHPLHSSSTPEEAQAGQLVILLAPTGLHLVCAGPTGSQAELSRLGASLLRQLLR